MTDPIAPAPEGATDTPISPEQRLADLEARLAAAEGEASRLTEDFLRAKGMVRLRINTLVANDSAKRAYGKQGFEPYEVMMEKRLKQP